MKPYLTDLFGEIPVTWPEVYAWLAAVPRLAPDSPRARWYIENWNVPAKVQAAKAAGTFESTVNPATVLASDFVARRLDGRAFDHGIGDIPQRVRAAPSKQ